VEPADFVEELGRERAAAIIRSGDAEVARRAMRAAVRGGFRIVEFTLTTPGALELVTELAAEPDLIVGAGTVMDRAAAAAAVAAGARFLVSPVVDEAVIAAARDLGVAVLPGAHTPTEMWRAHRAGARLVKLFPAPAGGPAFVSSVLGPMPFLRIVPTSGVDASNAAAYLAAGAHAVGFVRSLFDPDLLASGSFDEIEARARELIALTRPTESYKIAGR
jgi:2-dehydro-3-deoxyphosphogluconate aldolase/(4S)-4-hydroxy-2-oxoglutarate aldolase